MREILSRRLSNALNAAVLLLLGIYFGLSHGFANLVAAPLTILGALLVVYNLNAIILRFQLWADRKLRPWRERKDRVQQRWQNAKRKLPAFRKKQPPVA